MGNLNALVSKVYKFPPVTFPGLMHVWLISVTQKTIPHFSMFHDGRELWNFPRGKKKYNDMENIAKLVFS